MVEGLADDMPGRGFAMEVGSGDVDCVDCVDCAGVCWCLSSVFFLPKLNKLLFLALSFAFVFEGSGEVEVEAAAGE